MLAQESIAGVDTAGKCTSYKSIYHRTENILSVLSLNCYGFDYGYQLSLKGILLIEVCYVLIKPCFATYYHGVRLWLYLNTIQNFKSHYQ